MDPSELTLGALIRDLRGAVGLSQERLADRLCELSGRATVTRDEVKRWECGKRTPRPFWLRHLAVALQIPLSTLEEVASVHRRVFITDVATSAVASVAAADLLTAGFAAALTADRPSDEVWREKVAVYGQDYMSLGAGEIQRRLAADLVVLQQQVDQPRTWLTAAKLMTLYGKTFPGNDGAKAVRWYRMAATAADRSEDDEVRGWVRGRAAIALGYEGASLPVADMMGRQALQIADGRPSLGRLNAIMGMAHVAAVRGDRQGALKLLDDGRRVFDVAASDDGEESDYAVPWWRMNVFISLAAARLGDERTAVAAQEQAEANLPASMPRFLTHLELHRALMMVRAGDADGGSAYARAALDRLPPEKHSLTLRMLLAEIERPAAT